MKNARNSIGVLAIISTVLVTGCQNKLHVRIEKVVGVQSLNPDSELGRQIEEAGAALEDIFGTITDAQIRLDEFIDVFPRKERRKLKNETLEWRDVLKEIGNQARALREECEACLYGRCSHKMKLDPRATLRNIRRFAEKQAEIKSDWEDTFGKLAILQDYTTYMNLSDEEFSPENKKKLESAKTNLEAVLTEISSSAGLALRASAMAFGGFKSTDVYPINPSDPMYAEILKSQSPIWAVIKVPFWSNTSLEPMTETWVGVSGDSAIMVVMEHPGQARVFQVSNDPAQITRNIGLLISKATSAAAKYTSDGLAP